MCIKVMLIDDHKIVLESIQKYLEGLDGIKIVGTASDGMVGLDTILVTKPDIVIMDVTLPGMHGLDLTRIIKEKLNETKVCALSMHTERKYIRGMMEAGASGYVSKSDPVHELVEAIFAVHAGKTYFSKKIAENLPLNLPAEPGVNGRDILDLLSDMDRQVLKLVAEGLSSKQIALMLHCTRKNVDYHRQNVMRKLGINSVAGLTKFAIQQGITSLEQH